MNCVGAGVASKAQVVNRRRSTFRDESPQRKDGREWVSCCHKTKQQQRQHVHAYNERGDTEVCGNKPHNCLTTHNTNNRHHHHHHRVCAHNNNRHVPRTNCHTKKARHFVKGFGVMDMRRQPRIRVISATALTKKSATTCDSARRQGKSTSSSRPSTAVVAGRRTVYRETMDWPMSARDNGVPVTDSSFDGAASTTHAMALESSSTTTTTAAWPPSSEYDAMTARSATEASNYRSMPAAGGGRQQQQQQQQRPQRRQCRQPQSTSVTVIDLDTTCDGENHINDNSDDIVDVYGVVDDEFDDSDTSYVSASTVATEADVVSAASESPTQQQPLQPQQTDVADFFHNFDDTADDNDDVDDVDEQQQARTPFNEVGNARNAGQQQQQQQQPTQQEQKQRPKTKKPSRAGGGVGLVRVPRPRTLSPAMAALDIASRPKWGRAPVKGTSAKSQPHAARVATAARQRRMIEKQNRILSSIAHNHHYPHSEYDHSYDSPAHQLRRTLIGRDCFFRRDKDICHTDVPRRFR